MGHVSHHHSTRAAARGGALRRMAGNGALRRMAAMSGLAAALAGCATPAYPPVAAGIAGDAAFKARVAERYRPGTPAGRLRGDLADEGFTILEDPVRRRASALFRAGNLPCGSQVRIDWTEDRRGRIAEIQARRSDCT